MSVQPSGLNEKFPRIESIQQKALVGLRLRAGEIDHQITALQTGSKEKKIGFIFSKFVIKTLEKEKVQINLLAKKIHPELPLTEKTAQAPVTLEGKLQEQQSLIQERNTIKDILQLPQYRMAWTNHALNESGLLGSHRDPESDTLLQEIYTLDATITGLDYALAKVQKEISALKEPKLNPIQKMVGSFTSKISTKYNQFKENRAANRFAAKLQNDMQKHGLLGFVERNTKTDFRALLNNPQLHEVRAGLLANMNDQLASGTRITHHVAIKPQTLHEVHKEPLGTLDELPQDLQDQVIKWHALIPDYTACKSTLGRKDLSTVHIAGVPLTKLSNEIGQIANVAHMCQQLENAFIQKWPNEKIEEIQQLVVDAVTLMAIDINPIRLRGDLNSLRMGLMTNEEMATNRRIVASDKRMDPDYEFTLLDLPTPACTIQINQEFKDVEGDPGAEVSKGEFAITSTITVTKAYTNNEYSGVVEIARK
ncbi:MAG: hypothetical protein LLF94_06215 [Chlamydiales bacterium]|nr:hypothetical protein [Chlamydiales bacterium]